MQQLELFDELSLSRVRYLSPEECVERGYALFPGDALRCLMIPVDYYGNVLKDYNLIKTSVQQQWKIVFNRGEVSL